MFDRDAPFNELPPLPPAAEVETAAVLKKAIAASRALAELKGMAERMPNQAMLIDSLVLQEARASSEIENILTTNDELFKAASDESLPASAEAKEVLRYRQALNHGFREIKERSLATGLFIEIAQLIKQTDFSVRRTPGTRIANARGETIYTPPEGEAVIRDKLRDLENFMHAEDGLDVLVKMALVHYQFEAIHPFPDGNGRAGRILNILYLVDRGLLNLPVLYLSRHIIDHKPAYYEGLRRVTEEGAWSDWGAVHARRGGADIAAHAPANHRHPGADGNGARARAARGAGHLQQGPDRANLPAALLQDPVPRTCRHGHAADLRQVPARAGAPGRAARPEDRPGGVLHQPSAVRPVDAMRWRARPETNMLKVDAIF
jgi:prophage maintenance system killer protein